MAIDFEKHALILRAVEELNRVHSWTGKTHVNKVLFLASLKAEMPFDYILYKHGPFSFDVDDELSEMQSYKGVTAVGVGQYGSRFEPGPSGEFVKNFAEIIPERMAAIQAAADLAGNRDVTGLEALATSAWVIKKEGQDEKDQVARRVSQLKPHLPKKLVGESVKEALAFLKS